MLQGLYAPSVAELDPEPVPRRQHALLLVFTATVFTSATLLFLVQPMFGKMVLPLLGGTPAVWNTSMLFFQAMLLAGYLYAHLATRGLGVQKQARVHVVLLAVSLLALPIGVGQGWQPPREASPIPWLLLLLTVSIGLPFFVLSSSGPMLQRWFASTSHPDAENPYFLYAASNLGSMVALLGYPLLLEPHLRLVQQSWVWTGGYGALVALTVGCAWLLWREPVGAPHQLAASASGTGTISNARRVRWVLLALLPSSLLLGVTQFLSLDIAAIPLLWVVPLALYLLTFTIVFARKPGLLHVAMVRLQPVVVLPLAILMFWNQSMSITVLFPLHLLAFFVTTMVCHGELSRDRPPAADLTEFYLWISVGGVLGGIFNVLIAPAIFDRVIEYPLAIALACMLRPALARGARSTRSRVLDLLLPLAFGLALLWLGRAVNTAEWSYGEGTTAVLSAVIAIVGLQFASYPIRFGLAVGALLLAGGLTKQSQGEVLIRERTFFGTHRVVRDAARMHHRFVHGSTLHGAQARDPAERRRPLTYYQREGPFGRVFEGLQRPPGERRVAVVGLGTGAAACYAAPGDEWTFYEIDPAVERIARNPRYFTFLQDCAPDARVVLGDARLSLADAPDHHYDLIVLDAFSSDAIPVHLMTREALALYLSKLREGGAIAFHISNRYLDLEPVLAALVRDAGLVGMIGRTAPLSAEQRASLITFSRWVVVGRQAEDLLGMGRGSLWPLIEEQPDVGLWTDDFSNLLSIFRWR